MTGPGGSGGPEHDGRRRLTARNVPALLLGLRSEQFTGTVRVPGSPGGTIHLRDGLVGAVETPGAPGAEVTLLKSGRIGDDAWTAARVADRSGDRLGAELVSGGFIGAAEFQVVCTAAVFDGAFAMVLSSPGHWEVSGRVSAVVAEPGVEPERLREETTRRVALLTRLWGAPGELARSRVGPAPSADRATEWLPRRYQEILADANGRRTPRDIAFAQGRGLYAVMLDLVRMDALRLLRWDTGAASVSRPSTAPRTVGVRHSDHSAGSSDEPSGVSAPLPRRKPSGALPEPAHAWRGEQPSDSGRKGGE